MRNRSGRRKASLSRDKGCGVEAVTSAGTFQGCYAEEVLTYDCSACAVRLLSVTVGRPPYRRRVSFGAPALMRHRENIRCGPTRTRRERGADVPGPKSDVHGLSCLVREETTSSTKVVLCSRVHLLAILTWRAAAAISGRLRLLVFWRLGAPSVFLFVFGVPQSEFPLVLSLVRLGPRSLLCVLLSVVSDLGSLFRCSLVWAAWFLVLLRVSLPPGEGHEYFSVFLVLIASWKVFEKVVFVHLLWVTLVGPWLRLALSGCLVEFLADVAFFRRLAAFFAVCGVPARWRDLRHVFLSICRK